MRRANLFLAGIIAQQFGFAALAEAQFWHYFPDGDIPEWVQVISKWYWYWVVLVALLYFWCKADAKDRQVVIPVTTSVLVPLLFPIGIPYYFLRTYSTRPAILHIGWAVIFVASCVAAFWLGHMLTFDYYAIWTNHPRTK
jgi:hypothetical protein